MWQGGRPGDFELRLQFRIFGGNSGVQYRSRVLDDQRYIVTGYQADIDSSPVYTGINYEEKGRDVLADRGQKVHIGSDGHKAVIGSLGDKVALQRFVKNEDWNNYRIVVKGNSMQHFVNDVLMSHVIDDQSGQTIQIETGPQSDRRLTDYAVDTSGIIALQLHRGPPMKVQFRDLQLKEL